MMNEKSSETAPQPGEPVCEDIRTSSSPAAIARAIVENLYYVKGRTPGHATINDWYTALAYTVRAHELEGAPSFAPFAKGGLLRSDISISLLSSFCRYPTRWVRACDLDLLFLFVGVQHAGPHLGNFADLPALLLVSFLFLRRRTPSIGG